MTTPNKPAPAPLTQEELQAATKILVSEGITSEDHGNIIVERAYRLRAEAYELVCKADREKRAEIERLKGVIGDHVKYIRQLASALATHKAALRKQAAREKVRQMGPPPLGADASREWDKEVEEILNRWLTEAQAKEPK